MEPWVWDGMEQEGGMAARHELSQDTWTAPNLPSPSSSTANSLGTIKSSKLGWKGDAELGTAHSGVSEQPELF